jgi:hypothetical protein
MVEQRQGRFARRGFLAAAGTGIAATGLAGLASTPAFAAGGPTATTPAGSTRTEYVMPTLTCANTATQQLLGPAYESALTDLVGINTAYAVPATYDVCGELSYPPGTFVRAGGGYPEPQRWTRDAAVNAWNATSLLGPVVGRNTLYAVVDKQADGSLIVQQDNQWWDQIIWVVGAWNHYLITGDEQFLGTAYQISVSTLAARRAANLNSTFGLFEGPSFMNDGIAGYPSPPWEAGIDSSFVLDYPNADKLMCLSTNCIYHGAHLALAGMADALGHSADAASYRTAATNLRTAINTHLWRADVGSYGYFVHGADQLAGQLDPSQEGAGLAFAILFGVADATRTTSLLTGAHWEPHGIVNVWPSFPLFSQQQPGRHNVSVWPMVHSMFGHAAAAGGRVDLFGRAVTELVGLVSATDNGFYELYNSQTGVVDGGWQTGGDGQLSHFTSQPDQAWSASGYLRMIHHGLFGLQFGTTGLSVVPSLPSGWGQVTLAGVPYRDATLDLTLTGAGNHVTASTVDGKAGQPVLPATSTGHHTIHVTLAQS